MKTYEILLFGISIDEHVLFKASLFILCILSLLLILTSILIVWLRKIQRRVVSLTKNTSSLPLVISNKKAPHFKKRNSWKTLVGANAYGPLGFDGDGPLSDLPQETSFNNSLASGNDEVDDSSVAHLSTRNHPHQKTKGDYKLEKDYMSLKNCKGANDHTYAKPCTNSPRVKSKMGCDKRQNGKALNEQKNNDSLEDDHGYLVVIHSDKSSALSEGNEKQTPPNADESLYLNPIESKLEEKGHPKMESKNRTESEGKSKANGVSKNDDRTSHLDAPEEGKYRYLASQHLKDGADGKTGTNIAVGLFQAGDLSESDGPVNTSHGDDNSYEYIQTEDRTRPADNNDSKLQKNNTTGKAKPFTNSSAKDNHGYLTPVVHETEVNSSKEKKHSTDQISSIIQDSNNNTNAGVQSEVAYANQNGVQNLGFEYPDDVPVYANNNAQQQSSMCNDNAAFCNVDESPLYDNP